MIKQIQKIKQLFILSLFFLNASQAQSLIQKFVDTTFKLSEAKKSPDGYYFENVSFNLKEHFILMINAVGDKNNCKPTFIVKGSTENGIETAPTLKFTDTSTDRETNAVYIINKTDNYSIFVANGRQGEKGIIKTKMGLGNMEWLNDATIFPNTNKTEFALAMNSLLFQAIFNFNLIKGKHARWGGFKPTLEIPNAKMDKINTKIDSFLALNADMKKTFYYGITYVMDDTEYEYVIENRKNYYNKIDTSIAITKYEKLKILIANSLPSNFSVERETIYPLLIENAEVDTSFEKGCRIIFTNKGNEILINPSDNNKFFLAKNKTKVEICLEPSYNKSVIYLRVYSEEK
jgi:hypothetical protein